MATFTDDFNRANGALGGNWVTVSGTPNISSNWLIQNGAGSCSAYNTTLSDSGRHEARGRFTLFAGSTNNSGLRVKCSGAGTGNYWARVNYSAGTYSLHIMAGLVNSEGSIASVNLPSAPPGIYTMSLIWDNGHLTATIDGMGTVEVDNNSYPGGLYMGVSAQTTVAQCDWVTFITGSAPAFSVTPDVIPNYGTPTVVTFTGTNTEWTPGTPGSPTFTCDHGTLSDQTVDSATSAYATFDPGDYLGPVVFTDPSTGLTDTCVVSSDVGTVPPGDQCPFDQDFIDTANATVLADNRGLPTLQSIIVPAAHGWSDVYLQEAIADIWYSHFRPEDLDPDYQQPADRLAILWQWISGSDAAPTGPFGAHFDEPLNVTLRAIFDAIGAMRTTGELTLADVIVTIQGTPTYTLAHLHDDIAAISAGSNADVLAMLTAMWGAEQPTLTDIASLIQQLSTIAGYNLADVLTAIGTIHDTDLPAIAAKLDLIQPTNANSIDDVLGNLATTDGVVDTMAASLAALRGPSLTTLQDILDAIAAIPGGPGGGAAAPVWPGIAGVTLGTPVAFTGNVSVTAPMDGVIVTLTTPPTRVGSYQLGTETLWYGVGRIAFENDNGQLEPWQYLAWNSGIHTPHTMLRASAVHLQVLGGAEGTVTPWTIS